MIGAYAFVTDDWRDLDYPLDLWLDWNSQFFDQIALVTYGKILLEFPKNSIIKEVGDLVKNKGFDFYVKGKSIAQSLLNTEWKVALDIDEFVGQKINTDDLNQSRAYALRMRHLYGNVNTEIVDAFPQYYFRCHYGNRKLLGDGGSVVPPFAAKLKIRPLVEDVAWKLFGTGRYGSPFEPWKNNNIEIWHTGALRRPDVMSKKWRMQIQRETENKIYDNVERMPLLESGFDYHNFRALNPRAHLRQIPTSKLPRILLDNQLRFNHAQFNDNEYFN